ncbi:MAG: DNA-3-methyladenine glycosylase [Bacteroidota bacterium]
MDIKLATAFYDRTDVLTIASELLGKVIVTQIDGERTAGMIVETEAYSYHEKASHAYNNRRTARTEVIFGEAGRAYVYLCYGIHKLLNFVTNKQEVAEVVLIRAIEPIEGTSIMMRRRGLKKENHQLTSGPGKLTKALGIDMMHNTISLIGDVIWVEDRGFSFTGEQVMQTPRIGVDYAEEDASLPWRFSLANNPWVSK